MPWTAKDAFSHTHLANTPAKQQTWARIATQKLNSGASEASAIRIANYVVGRIHGKPPIPKPPKLK